MSSDARDGAKRLPVLPGERAPMPRPKTLPIISPEQADVPDAVPARMINEVLYCERLLYLEWVQGEFENNVFTADGTLVHRRVDAGKGKLQAPPKPGDATSEDEDVEVPPPFEARSVWLTSETLGLTAKLDVVEGENGIVVPIEHKRGKAPNVAEGAYLPERAQVCAQVLLLREHGYNVPHGEIWFSGERRRVPITITEGLIQTTLGAIRRVKEIAQRAVIPEPLVDDPKCKGCSLVGICLPDEVTLLKGLAGHPLDAPEVKPEPQLGFDFGDLYGPMEKDPWGLAGEEPEPPPMRRLHPSHEEGTALYVTTPGARLALDGDTLRVEGTGTAPVHARLPQTSHIAVFGNVQITTQAMVALLERDIPVMFFSSGGWLRGRTTGHGTKNVELRIAQHRVLGDPEQSLPLARAFVAAKLRNQRTMLRRNATGVSQATLHELEFLAKKAEQAESVESLLGLEGTGAREYFGSFTKLLKGSAAEGDFDMSGRNRRPPKDPINALLSMAYSLLTKDYVAACLAVGLEPLIGALHKPRYGRPALALDLMEEMRPLVADSVVVNALNTQVVTATDFVRSPGGCALTPPGRKRFIEAYERRVDQLVSHPIFGYRISYRRIFEVQARLFARCMTGEIDAYPAFRTR